MLISLLPSFLQAQSCFQQKDELTGKMIMSGSVTVDTDTSVRAFRFSLARLGEERRVTVSFLDQRNLFIADTSRLLLSLHFDNGTIVRLPASSGTRLTSFGPAKGVLFNAGMQESTFRYLLDNTLVKIDLEYGEPGFPGVSIAVPQKTAREIRNIQVCLQ